VTNNNTLLTASGVSQSTYLHHYNRIQDCLTNNSCRTACNSLQHFKQQYIVKPIVNHRWRTS